MPREPKSGKSRKQAKHLKKARDARRKENIPNRPLSQPPLSPKSHALADNVRLVSEIKQLEKEKKNAARREKRLRKKITDLNAKTQEAQEELRKATAHSEAQVCTMLKKKMEDDKGWQRRVAEAERRLDDAEHRRAWSNEELKKKISDLSQLRGVLRLARHQNNHRKEISKRATNRSHSAKHLVRMHAKRGRAYKVELRAIARVLVSSGSKEGKVGDLMQDITRIFGVDLDRAMSRWTVRRAVLEGLVASQVQLGVEMKYSGGNSANY
jgi:chromosome segregation ATPase